MMDTFNLFLKEMNDNYSDLLLVMLGAITLYIGYKEYIIKRRPYVFPEIDFEKQGEDWYFNFILKNSGNYPAQSKINSAVLKIGDEAYPTQFNSEMLVPVGEHKKLLPIGHINKLGRTKIINGEYKSNRVEIGFKVASKELSDKNYKYMSEVEYEVDVKGEMPTIKLVSEKFS